MKYSNFTKNQLIVMAVKRTVQNRVMAANYQKRIDTLVAKVEELEELDSAKLQKKLNGYETFDPDLGNINQAIWDALDEHAGEVSGANQLIRAEDVKRITADIVSVLLKDIEEHVAECMKDIEEESD